MVDRYFTDNISEYLVPSLSSLFDWLKIYIIIFLENVFTLKGPVCGIYRDLLAEMEYNIHSYVLISV